MNKARELIELGNFYTEKVTFPPKGTFELTKDAKEKKKPFVGKVSGPEAAGGFEAKKYADPKTTAKKKDTFQEVEKFSSQKFSEKVGKSETKSINNYMSNIFDKLFEEVMGLSQDDQDAQDLGLTLPAAGEKPAGEVGGEGEKVTLELDKELAHKLHDLLMAALGSEDKAEDKAEGEAEGTEGGEGDESSENNEAEEANEEEDDESEEDNQEVAGEATATETLSDSKGKALQSKNNKVGDVTNSLKSSGGGDGKVTDKCGNDGDKGHALVGSGVKGGASTSPKGKANVVAGKASNVGQYITQK